MIGMTTECNEEMVATLVKEEELRQRGLAVVHGETKRTQTKTTVIVAAKQGTVLQSAVYGVQEEEEEDMYHLFHLKSAIHSHPLTVTVTVKDHLVQIEVDTGAAPCPA